MDTFILREKQTSMFDTFVISKTSFKTLCQFFASVNVGKITIKFQILSITYARVMAWLVRKQAIYILLGASIRSYQILSNYVFFLLSVVAGKDCFSLSSSFAFCGKTARKQSCISEFFQFSFFIQTFLIEGIYRYI